MCVRYYKRFGWKSREVSKKAMDYRGNDQYNGKMKETEECKVGRKNYRGVKNELKRATDKAKKEYLDITRDGMMEF